VYFLSKTRMKQPRSRGREEASFAIEGLSDKGCKRPDVNGLTRQLGWRGRSDDDRDTGCRECYDATEEEAAGQVGQGCGA
jgi:hypothetical protein